MSEPIIKLENLTKRYGQQTAVDHLTLSIQQGEVFGLLGPNGAGKSTTILMMLGLSEPSNGTATVCGVNATRQPILVKEHVGYLPDEVGFYDDRTGWDNLLYTAYLNRIPKQEAISRAKSLFQRVSLAEAADKKVGTYSRGMRQRLGLADVLIKRPEVIILDEPTLGIDPKGVRELLKLIQTLSKDEGITVILSSHHLHQVQQICDRVGLFVKGKLLACGEIASLSKQLFGEQPTIVEFGLHPVSNKLLDALRNVDGVKQIEQTQDGLNVTCEQGLTAKLVKVITSFDEISLVHVHEKEYGLDDIYHRYFEGGESHES